MPNVAGVGASLILKTNVRNDMILGKKIIYGALFCISLSGCGGSDGGGGGDAAPSGLTYTGLTTQVKLTAGNGEEISASSYKNGDSGPEMGTTFTGVSEVNAELGKPRASTLAKILVTAVKNIEPANSDEFFSGAVVTESDTNPGSCGGTASYTMSIDDVTGDFNGSMTFDRYCESGTTINGSITMSGTFNSMTMTMTAISITSGSDTARMDGTISFDSTSAETSVITMNMKVKAAGSDDVFWMENYVLTIAVVSGGVDLTMSGRFYHPSHGYVDISTSTPFHYAGTNLYPYPGVMVAAGSNGSTATLTSLSTTEYQIDIHTGTSVHSNTGLWAEL